MSSKKLTPLDKEWKVKKCTTKDCWCSWVTFKDDPDGSDMYVIPTGSVTTKEARHIVKLHNEWLKGRKKNV